MKCVDEGSEELYKNHGTFNEGDSGVDLFFIKDIIIPTGETVLVDLGVAAQGYSNTKLNISKFRAKGLNADVNIPTSYWLVPRSSIYKTPLRLANSIGLIDSGYTNTLKAPIDNIGDEDYLIKRGTRLLQIASPTLSPISIELVKHLRDTQRGKGGLGSTGV